MQEWRMIASKNRITADQSRDHIRRYSITQPVPSKTCWAETKRKATKTGNKKQTRRETKNEANGVHHEATIVGFVGDVGDVGCLQSPGRVAMRDMQQVILAVNSRSLQPAVLNSMQETSLRHTLSRQWP